jgi:glycine oxidase
LNTAVSRSEHALQGGRWAVAGSGVVGTLTALALARAGAAVLLCDPAPPSDNASGVAAGMLAPAMEAALDPHVGLDFQTLAAARDLWPALAARTGVLLDRSGALLTGRGVESATASLATLGAEYALLTASQAAGRAPGLAATGPVLFSPEDWRLDARQTLIQLRRAAGDAGVVFVAAALSGRDLERGRIQLSNGEAVAVDGLVLATGAASGLGGLQRLIAPVKGQIVRSAGGPTQGPVVRGDGVYVAPSAGGAVIGATMEAADDRTVDPAVVARLLAAGAALFPALADAPSHGAAAVRAATPDGLPLIGRTEDSALVAVGMRRNGWLLAPMAAEIIVALARGDENAPGLFDPRRFP